PQVIAETVVESVPEMLSLAGVTRVAAVGVFSNAVKSATASGATREVAIAAGREAVQKAAPKLATLSATLEGAQSAGSTASEYASEGRLKEREALASLAAGAATATVGIGLNKLAPRLGLEDVETSIATSGLRDGSSGIIGKTLGGVKGAAKGALREGPLEEGAQSTLEQMAQNFGGRRQITEGVGQAFVEGAASGAALGAIGGGFAGAQSSTRGDEIARQLDAEVDATGWAPGSDTKVAMDLMSPYSATESVSPTPGTTSDYTSGLGDLAPSRPTDFSGLVRGQMGVTSPEQPATVEPSATATWRNSEDGIEYPVRVVAANVPTEDGEKRSLVEYNGVEVLVPTSELIGTRTQPEAPRTVSFTPADSPTAQAGLQPIIVPEIRNVSSTVEPGPLFGNRGEITGTDFRGSLADSGRDTAVGRGLGVDTGSPGTLGGQVATATGGVVQSAPRVKEWTGNRGAGYPTQQDAEAAIPRRQSQDPDYDWQVQPNDAGQFKLVGTLQIGRAHV